MHQYILTTVTAVIRVLRQGRFDGYRAVLNVLVSSLRASRKAIIHGVTSLEKGAPLSCEMRLVANHFPARCIHQTYLVGVLVFFVIGSVGASEEVSSSTSQQTVQSEDLKLSLQQTAQIDKPAYVPPFRGAPSNRIGGASRGAEAGLMLDVIAPEQSGLTLSPQPTLYWYTSALVPGPLEVTVAERRAVKPLIEVRIEAPKSAGFGAVDLSDYGVSLEPGVEYLWSVAWVLDPAQRSQDIMASGGLRLSVSSPELAQRIAALSPGQRAYEFAAEGFWYDAIDTLSQAIKIQPREKHLRIQRAQLLELVKLPSAARHDLKIARQF